MSVTVADFVVELLQDLVDNQLQLSNNPDEWDVPELIHLINETDPELLYDPQSIGLIVEFMPASVIARIPQGILMYHGLCEFMTPDTIEYFECAGLNMTLPPLDFCVGPLVHTSLPHAAQQIAFNGTLLFQGCAPSCAFGKQYYSFTDEEQHSISVVTTVSCCICFVMILFLVMNHYYDEQSSKQAWNEKSLLQVIPYLVTSFLFVMVLCMTLPELIGKEHILCQKNVYDGTGFEWEDDRVLALYAPLDGDQNWRCGVSGVIYYSSILFYLAYSALFSFVIFRAISGSKHALCGVRQVWCHVAVFCAVAPFVVVSVLQSRYNVLWPIGVCFPSTDLFGMVCLPALGSCAISGVFLTLTVVVMCRKLRNMKDSSRMADTDGFRALSIRLVLYGCGLQCTCMLMVMTVFEFEQGGAIANDIVRRAECQIQEALVVGAEDWSFESSECNESDVFLNPFWFQSWSIFAMFGVISQTVLACHHKTQLRLKSLLNRLRGRRGNRMASSSTKREVGQTHTKQDTMTTTIDGRHHSAS